LAVLVLAAVLVGVAIPALVQLRATLRALEKSLQGSSARLEEALGTTTAAARRIDALVVRLEEGGRIEQFVDGLTAVSRMLTQLRDTVRVASAVGAAVGPAVAAAVHAFRDDRQGATPEAPRPAEVASGEGPPEPGRQATP
jgi:hypothetical protein